MKVSSTPSRSHWPARSATQPAAPPASSRRASIFSGAPTALRSRWVVAMHASYPAGRGITCEPEGGERAGRRAPGGQRPAGERRGGLPQRRGRDRRPPAPPARRRDGRALGLDRLAVPAVQLAPAVRDGAAGRILLPRAAAAAPAQRGRHERAGVRGARLRVGGDRVVRHVRGGDNATRRGPRPAGAARALSRPFLAPLPPPLARVSAFVALEDQAELEPIYEAQMQAEVERILAAIPADQLAIQWDARYEFAMLEGAIEVWFDDVQAGIVERLLRLGSLVPEGVELGYHLCYGDDESGHFAEPEDATKLVAVANALAAPDWIHLPVPAEREDDRYFAPLRELRLPATTELYLGLIHAGDADGSRRRIAAAREHVQGFGIATECGWGRGGAAAVAGLLELHRELSAPLAGGSGFRWPEGFVPAPHEDWD